MVDYFNVKTHDINVTKTREILTEYICSIKFQDMREGVTLHSLRCIAMKYKWHDVSRVYHTTWQDLYCKVGATRTIGIVRSTFMTTNNIT